MWQCNSVVEHGLNHGGGPRFNPSTTKEEQEKGRRRKWEKVNFFFVVVSKVGARAATQLVEGLDSGLCSQEHMPGNGGFHL